MRIDDTAITGQLEKIRTRHGLGLGEFVPGSSNLDIGEDLSTQAEVEALFHDSGLLVRGGQPVLAYIRDHTSFGPFLNPQQSRKVHFTVCAALKSMKAQGRFERYRITNGETNIYVVDVRVAWNRTEEREVGLHPCQYCLGNVKYRGFDYRLRDHEKRAIVENFDAKELFSAARKRLAKYWEQNVALGLATKDAKRATVPSGYPDDWKDISKRLRRSEDFTCGECKVRLGERPDLLHAHHKDGDKSNVRQSNLVCRCILCHHNEHPHLGVKKSDRLYIEAQRVRQGSSRPL